MYEKPPSKFLLKSHPKSDPNRGLRIFTLTLHKIDLELMGGYGGGKLKRGNKVRLVLEVIRFEKS